MQKKILSKHKLCSIAHLIHDHELSMSGEYLLIRFAKKTRETVEEADVLY